jgi:muramoyltetrapeptide carboxypeptidase
MHKLIPAKLSPGDAIGIVSPSGPVRVKELYDRGVAYLRSKGYKIVEAPHALSRLYHMSASGKEKAEDIHAMFADQNVKAIFPTVGGHTASQAIEHLDWDFIRSHPKILFGFSDNAVLINAIHAKTGLVCFHSLCDVVFGFGVFGQGKLQTDGEYTSTQLFKVITNARPAGDIPRLSKWTALRSGIAEGPLIGGNLSTLRSLIGTEYEPDWDGCILFLEDSAEPHRWDQQLGHLRLAGILDRISGLVVGKVEKPDTFYPENFRPLPEIFLQQCDRTRIPILYGVDLGHNVENCTLPIGIDARLDCVKNSLELLEAAVKV